MRAIAVLVAIVALAPACSEPFGSGDLPPPTFVVKPSTVAPGDSFTVVFTLRNPSARPVTITSGAGCLFFLQARRDTEPVSVQGLAYLCTAVVTHFQVPPFGSIQGVRRAAAVERSGAAPGQPLPAGEYRIRTIMNAALPDVEALLTVVDTSGAT